jgi:hypothetical protein
VADHSDEANTNFPDFWPANFRMASKPG